MFSIKYFVQRQPYPKIKEVLLLVYLLKFEYENSFTIKYIKRKAKSKDI